MKINLVTLHVRPSAQAVPLAAASLKAALPPELQEGAVLVDLFPASADEELLTEILAGEPDVVAFSLYVWSRERLLPLSRELRRCRPSLFLVAGGPEATVDAEAVLAEGELDAVIRGEGEETFAELMALRAQNKALQPIPGLTLRSAAGILTGPDRSPVEDLDTLPSPWLSGALLPAAGGGVLWEIARGCPFACDFCYDARGSRGVRHLSTGRLKAELDLFVRAGVSQVWVLDSTFNFPAQRGKTLLQLLAERAPGIHFHLEAKADYIDRKTARLLGRIPCSVQVGLQSAHPEVLRNIHRALDPQLFAERVQFLAAEGVTYGLDLIYGLPGDDHRGFCQSLEFALELRPNHLDIFPLAVLPGTPLHANRERFGLRADNSPPYLVLESATCPPDQLAASRRLASAAAIFYNIGRAVAYFPALLRGTGLKAVPFLERFADFLAAQPGGEERLLESEGWAPQEVLKCQERFVADELRACGRPQLISGAVDLLRYHYYYAETLLGAETLPDTLCGLDPWRSPWRVASTVRLVPFSYEILNLLEMGEVDLLQLTDLFRPVGSVALFLRRGDEVICESLEEDFLTLLRGCDGRRTPEEIFAGSISRAEGEEIAVFAVGEGLLVPAGLT